MGGLQGTAQNLGASLGTALIGSLLIASLVSNFTTNILLDPALAGVSNQIATAAEANANFVTVDQVAAAAETAGMTPEQVDATTVAYAEAQIAALKAAFAGISLFSLLALWYVSRIPNRQEEAEREAAEKAQTSLQAV